MTDVTKNIGEAKQIAYGLHSFGDTNTYEVDVVDSGINATDTYAIVEIPKGKVFIGGTVMVCGDIASTGSATVKFTVGNFDVTSAIGIANLKRGTAIALNAGNAGSCKSNVTEVTQVKLTVGSAPLTAGRFIVNLNTIDVTKL